MLEIIPIVVTTLLAALAVLLLLLLPRRAILERRARFEADKRRVLDDIERQKRKMTDQ